MSRRNYWLLPDTHFGHTKLVREGHRPQSYVEKILVQASRVVREGDVLIHLGDVCIGDDAFWSSEMNSVLPGVKRWLIRGNHDNKSMGWYLDHGWDFVADAVIMDVFGARVALSHVPMATNSTGYDINIHGHHHNTNHHPEDGEDPRRVCLFLEHEYAPFNMEKVVTAKRLLNQAQGE